MRNQTRFEMESLQEKLKGCIKELATKTEELADARQPLVAKDEELAGLEVARNAVNAAMLANVDLLHVIDIINRRTFNKNSVPRVSLAER